jgi:hypothetical protein
VLWVDRYGNAQLNIDPTDIESLGSRCAFARANPFAAR